MSKTQVTILGCGSSLGVPRIDNYWGNADKNNSKNCRTRCSLFIKYRNLSIIIDTSPDIKQQLLVNKIILVGCGRCLGVPRIDGYWGKAKKKNKKNYRTRCSLFIKYGDMNILIDTSPDIKNQLLNNKIKKIDF
ncbi:MAG: MBL fold metallo-hydrolase, partial [Candidatus Fonsibacter ubiquis]